MGGACTLALGRWASVLRVSFALSGLGVARSVLAVAAIRSSLPADVKPGWAPPGSPVALHGALSVKGSQIVDEQGVPTQLRGMSLFWSQWMGQFWNADVIDWLVSDFNASFVRAAMGVEMGGYLENEADEKDKMKVVVEECILRGIYVIVDWHDHHASDHFADSRDFFTEFSKAYGKYPNVMWEVWNEPEDIEWSKEIKPYHEMITHVIRLNSPNIIVLGTDTWSQGVDAAAADPVEGDNLAYTLHFYAFSHKEDLRDKARSAMANGSAIMVTEWGTCDYSGNGTLDLDSAREWVDFLSEYNVSFANWAISDKLESCSALLPGAAANGSWQDADLTPSGYFVRKVVRNEDDGAACRNEGEWPCVRPKCAAEDHGCMEEECCEIPEETCFEKDEGWAQCMVTCEPDWREGETWTCNVKGGPFEFFKPPSYDFVMTWAVIATAVATCAIVYALMERSQRKQLEDQSGEESQPFASE